VDPLLYPGFCAEGWCWEAPLPHGTHLTAVYGDGDDVIVAGDNGMLAERRDGGWRSLQSVTPSDVQWRGLWGRSWNDVYLAGDSRVWQFDGGGWAIGASTAEQTLLTAVTGTSDEVLFGDELGRVHRLRGGGLELVADLDAGEILSMTPAFGALFALTRAAPWPVTALVKLDGGRIDFAGDGGSLRTVFGGDAGLWLAGESGGFSVSPTLVATPMAGGLTAGSVGPTGDVRAATMDRLGTLVGQLVTSEQSGANRVLAMHEGRSTTWAVGAAGLVLQRRDGGWVELTERPGLGATRAIAVAGDTLVAVTSRGQLLVRTALGWRARWSTSQVVVVDMVAASDAERVFILTEEQQVATVRRNGMSWQEEPPRVRFGQGSAAHRLWLTPAGTLVATSDEGVFVRRAGDPMFRAITNSAMMWGVAGRGEIVRACGATRWLEIDVSQTAPAVRASGAARGCRALVSVGDDWAHGGRDSAGAPFVVRMRDGAVFTFPAEQIEVEDMELVPNGIAVGINGIGLVPIDGGVVVMSDGGMGLALTPLRTRVSQGINGLVAWRGRLFAVGEDAVILQGPLP
jgi:hypothetical protein